MTKIKHTGNKFKEAHTFKFLQVQDWHIRVSTLFFHFITWNSLMSSYLCQERCMQEPEHECFPMFALWMLHLPHPCLSTTQKIGIICYTLNTAVIFLKHLQRKIKMFSNNLINLKNISRNTKKTQYPYENVKSNNILYPNIN